MLHLSRHQPPVHTTAKNSLPDKLGADNLFFKKKTATREKKRKIHKDQLFVRGLSEKSNDVISEIRGKKDVQHLYKLRKLPDVFT